MTSTAPDNRRGGAEAHARSNGSEGTDAVDSQATAGGQGGNGLSAGPRPRLVIVTAEPVSVTEAAGTTALLPNRQAARSLGVPFRSLEDLASRVVEEAGMHVAARLPARRLLVRAVLKALRSTDPNGLASQIEGTIAELLRSGVDEEVLLGDDNPRLRRLGRVLRAYRASLREANLVDRAELLWRAAEQSPPRLVLSVSGYPRLPGAERAFIDAQAGPGSVVHLPWLDDPLFEENARALEDFTVRGWEVRRHDAAPSGSSPGLRFLNANLQSPPTPPPVPEDPSQSREVVPTADAVPQLAAFSFADIEAESRGVLSAIKELLLNGVAADRVAIVARNEQAYGPVLLDVAQEYGVPLRVLYPVTLADTRLGGWLREFLGAVGDGFPFEATARFLAHPLARALPEGAWRDLRAGGAAGAEAWSRHLPPAVTNWPAEAPTREHVRRLREVFGDLRTRTNALAWPREAAAFALLEEELQALSELREHISFESFVAEVGELLSTLTVPMQPGRGGVELHSPLSLFGARVDQLFVVGATEGILPAPITSDPLLDPFEREELQRAGQHVEDVAGAARREELSFWALLHVARERLEFSLPRLVGRHEALPSPYLERLGLIAGKAPDRPSCSLRELRRTTLLTADGEEAPVEAVSERARRAHRVELRREGPMPADGHDGLVGVEYRPPRWGVATSRLIDLVNCPFKYFAKSLLKLDEPDEAPLELDYSLRGRLYHRTLHLVLEGVGPDADVREHALGRVAEALDSAAGELLLDQLPGWHMQRPSHLRVLRRAIEAEEFIPEGVTIRHLESPFAGEWRGVPVRGRIDRIDRQGEALTLVDYKAGKDISNLARDSSGQNRLDLQLSMYREAAPGELTEGAREVATRYYSITGAGDIQVKEPDVEELEGAARRVLHSWREGAYPVDPDIREKSCEYCRFESLCRRGPRLQRKRGGA